MSGIDSDGIILRQIQMIGYGDPKTIGSLNTMSSDALIKLVLYIFSKIPQTQNQLGQPPAGNSALFKFTTTMVSLITGLGYGEDLRYDNFLFPKGDITRSVLRYLLDKVPRTTGSGPSAATASTSLLSQTILSARTAFADAQKQKDKRSPLAQPIQLLNRSLKPAALEQIAAISSEPKVAFYGAPITANGVPFNQQAGPNVFASLLSQNDRDVNFDFAAAPAPAAARSYTSRSASATRRRVRPSVTGSQSSRSRAHTRSTLPSTAGSGNPKQMEAIAPAV